MYLRQRAQRRVRPAGEDKAAPLRASRTDGRVHLAMPSAASKTAEVTLHAAPLAEVAGDRRRVSGGHVGEFRVGTRGRPQDRPRLVTLPYLVGDQRAARGRSSPAGRRSRCSSWSLVDYYPLERLAAVDGQPRGRGRRGHLQRRHAVPAEDRRPAQRLLRAVLPHGLAAVRGGAAEHPQPEVALDARDRRAAVARPRGGQPRADYALSEGRRPLRHDEGGDHRPRDGLARRRRELHVPHPGGAGQGRRRGAGRLRPQDQDTLGFVYGPYNNYTDFAPVNEFWNEDLRRRALPDNQWQTAWMRCYAPKPARAVEFEARLAPIIQEKFHFSTAYCDVHTAVAPVGPRRLRRPRARRRHLRRHVLLLRRDHAAPEEGLERPGLLRGQQPLVLLRPDRRQLRPGPGGSAGREPLAGGFRPARRCTPCAATSAWATRRCSTAKTQPRQNARGARGQARPLPGGHGGLRAPRLPGHRRAACPTPCGATSAVQQVHARYAQQTAAEIRYADAAGTPAGHPRGGGRRTPSAARRSSPRTATA